MNEDEDFIVAIAKEKFGIDYLYPWQRLIIANILDAYEYFKMCESMSKEEKENFYKENSDSFCRGRQIVLLPTGAGKSMCFQVPAFVLDGPTLVIYPLLALMSDQKRRMEESQLDCVVFRGGQTVEEIEENFCRIQNGAKIILANPEVLQNQHLLARLSTIKIKHIAIDEAHCVSEWGDSFRPSYLQLGKIIKVLNPPMITAFTATASPRVLERMSEILFDGQAHVVRSESDRQNIHYYVKKAACKKKEVLKLALTEEKPMIIFCGTRFNAADMAKELNAFFNKKVAQFYHAGFEKSEKERIEQWFYNSTDGILCATCAYGMGVDKKNIKTVVHLEASTTAEAYIQEAGRGGRDGSVAKAILIWSLEDSLKFDSFGKNSRQYSMKIFAETTECRRQVLLNALGAEQAVCSGCDVCDEKNGIKEKDEPSDWQIALKLIKKYKNFYTPETLQEELTFRMNKYFVKTFGKKFWNHNDSKEVVRQIQDSEFRIQRKLSRGFSRSKRNSRKKRTQKF